MTENPLMTVKQAAHFMQVTTRTLYQWVRDGRVRCWRDGRTIAFEERHLRALCRPSSLCKRRPAP